MSHVRSVSGMRIFHVGRTNATLRPAQYITLRGDGVHPRCGGPYDGVVVLGRGVRGDETFRAGEQIAVALLDSGGHNVITVNDAREPNA